MFRVYRYVGPPEIAAHARGEEPGVALSSRADLERAALALGARPSSPLTLTYVVDLDGVLRVADRASEHVACAGGRPVLAAGELTARDGVVESATNLSTGYCPEPSCWSALAWALDRASIARPAALSHAFAMRRCERCGARSVVKDGALECAECDAALPARWSFDSVRWHRARWSDLWVDTIVASAGRDEDRVGVGLGEDELTLVLADGAGGTGRGAEAASRAVGLADDGVRDACAAIRDVDAALAAASSGECTTVLVSIRIASGALSLDGASVGDSRAWARAAGRWDELTASQHRKPLVGSGRARPVALEARAIDALVMTSDGIASYVAEDDLTRALATSGDRLGWALVDLARLPSGALRDDVSAIVVRRA